MEQPVDILIEGLKQFISNYEGNAERANYFYKEEQKLLGQLEEIREFLMEVKSVKNYYFKDGKSIHPKVLFKYKNKEIII